ncbi:Ras-related protein RABA5c [Vitis vinifera]|uniref:Ras-related protein RABA5c n=1 Tax=Vitis vinifera TaxID=29760 RepID=A0A438HCH2_VITVI|nr:Ras-related protein RABA5c [Vitis vinifera]
MSPHSTLLNLGIVELIISDSAKGDSRHNPLDPLTDRFLGPNGLVIIACLFCCAPSGLSSMTISFSSLYYFGHWLSQSLSFLWNNHAAHSETTVARMLVGNKSDLENIRDVSVEEGKSLAEAEGLFFIETSALDSTNVKKAFEIVIREIYNNISRKVLNSDSYKAELSVNRVSLVSNGADGAKQANSRYSCCS